MYFNVGNDRSHILQAISELPSDKFVVIIEDKTKAKTRAQRALAHKWLAIIADNTGYTLEEVKVQIKESLDFAYEPSEARMKKLVDWLIKLAPVLEPYRDRLLKLPIKERSSESYTRGEYIQFMDAIAVRAHELGLVLPQPR